MAIEDFFLSAETKRFTSEQHKQSVP